jgi:hypothetical protein
MIALRFILGFVEAPFFRTSSLGNTPVFFTNDSCQRVLCFSSVVGIPRKNSVSVSLFSTPLGKWPEPLADYSEVPSWLEWTAKSV